MLRAGRPLPRTRVLLAEGIVTGLATLAITAWHFRLWSARWREPWQIEGDSAFYLMLVRGLQQHGSYLHNPNLGWPFGQTLYDLPHGADNAHLLVLRLLAAVTASPGGAVNAFYVLTFFSVALTAHVVLRRLRFGRVLAALGAFAYAYAPYHFIRNEGHLLLSGYHLVPVGVLLALAMFDEPLPLLGHAGDPNGGRRLLDLRSSRTWWVAAACVGLASTGPYYLGFTLLLVGVAAAVHAAAAGSWRPVGAAALVIALCGAAFVVNVNPTLRYQRSHGPNTDVAARSPAETQLYGLKISQLFVPRQGHRVAKLASLSERSQGKIDTLRSEPGQQLGLFGAVGLAVLLAVAALQLAGGRRVRAALDGPRGTLLRRASLLTVVCLVTGAVGGLSYLLATAGARDLRSWNRISIVVAFLAIVASLVAIEWALHALDRRISTHGAGPRRIVRLATPLAGVVLAVAVFADQAGVDGPAYDAVHARYVADATFFRSVRTTLGEGAAVFELPYVAFPEAPVRVATGAYDQARGYVYEPSLNWSFGFVRGRHPAYPQVLETQPAQEWLTSIAAVGFTGVVVDRHGYTPADAAALEQSIAAIVGPPVAVADTAGASSAFYDVRAFAAATRTRLGEAGIAARAAATLALTPPPPAAPAVPSAG